MGNALKDRFAFGPQRLHGETNKQCHKQCLQYRTRGQGGKQRVGDDGLDESDGSAAVVSLGGVLHTGVFCSLDIQASTGFNEVPHHQADGQSKCGHGDEVNQRDATGFTHGCRSANGSDSQDNGAEDHRGDHHLDQVDEHRAHNLEFGGCAGCHQTEDNASNDRDDHSDVEPVGSVFPWLFRRSDAWTTTTTTHLYVRHVILDSSQQCIKCPSGQLHLIGDRRYTKENE